MVFGWAEASWLSASPALLSEVPLRSRRPGPQRSLLSSFPPFLLSFFPSRASSTLFSLTHLAPSCSAIPSISSRLEISSLAWLGLAWPGLDYHAVPCTIRLAGRETRKRACGGVRSPRSRTYAFLITSTADHSRTCRAFNRPQRSDHCFLALRSDLPINRCARNGHGARSRDSN